MAVKYTDQQIAELRERSTHDLESVKAFGVKHGVSHRSVLAKVKSLGLTYVTKAGTKTAAAEGSPTLGLSKEECITRVQKRLNRALPSLTKMNVTDLREMEDSLSDLGYPLTAPRAEK